MGRSGGRPGPRLITARGSGNRPAGRGFRWSRSVAPPLAAAEAKRPSGERQEVLQLHLPTGRGGVHSGTEHQELESSLRARRWAVGRRSRRRCGGGSPRFPPPATVPLLSALLAKLRDSGFKNDPLEQLGKSLEPNTSAVVMEIACGRSRRDAASLGARRGARGRAGTWSRTSHPVSGKKDTARNFGHRSAVVAALMRLAGIEPATSRSGGARSIP